MPSLARGYNTEGELRFAIVTWGGHRDGFRTSPRDRQSVRQDLGALSGLRGLIFGMEFFLGLFLCKTKEKDTAFIFRLSEVA